MYTVCIYVTKINTFLMFLQHLSRNLELVEEGGKKMNAITVFSLCIKYLMDHFMNAVKIRYGFVHVWLCVYFHFDKRIKYFNFMSIEIYF